MPASISFHANDGTLVHIAYDYDVEVSRDAICDRFNDGGYFYMTSENGGIEQAVEYNELASPRYRQPPGTLSQELIYHIDHAFVARVHQFLLPGDELDAAGLPYLGGYGHPEPKEL